MKEPAVAFDWKATLGSIAPWLAGTLGGPAAGIAVKALCKVAGLDPTPENAQKVAEMAAAGTLTGDQFLALRKLEQDHQREMQAMGYANLADLERIAYQDRDSARNREIKTGDSWTPRILAGVVILGWFALQWFLLTHVIPQEMREIVLRGLGTLDMAVGLVLGYYFGSSAGSAGKDQTIRDAASASRKD